MNQCWAENLSNKANNNRNYASIFSWKSLKISPNFKISQKIFSNKLITDFTWDFSEDGSVTS